MDTVVERRVGVLGRIVIPDEMREACGLRPGTRIRIWSDGNLVTLQPCDDAFCAICKLPDPPDPVKFNGKVVCRKCHSEMEKAESNFQGVSSR